MKAAPLDAALQGIRTGARIGTAFTFEDIQYEIIGVEGVDVRVATPESLVRMKRATVRAIDAADVAALVRPFGIVED